MKNEDGFQTDEGIHPLEPIYKVRAREWIHVKKPRLLGDLEEKHLPQTFSIATRVAHDGIRIVVTSVRITLSNLKGSHPRNASFGLSTPSLLLFFLILNLPVMTAPFLPILP